MSSAAVTALVALEERIDAAERLCRVLDAASGDSPPDWLCVFWDVVRGLNEAAEPLSALVRAGDGNAS